MMGWYTRSSRFIFDAYNRHHSKTSAFRSNSRISHNLVYQNVLNMNTQWNSPFVDGEKRFYSGDRRKIKHPIISALTTAGCVAVGGFVILQYIEKIRISRETVPYTNRRHCLVISISQEKRIGEIILKSIKPAFKEVAPDHPLSIRAQKIGGDIVEVVKSQNPHLNELEWEFFVLDDPASVRGSNFPGGKIVVPSGLLNRFRGDDEVEAFIAPEVAHGVARHHMEEMGTRIIERRSRAIIAFILSPFYDSREAERVFDLPNQRRMELEADYIGLILMAYAGYDPRVAPRLWEETGGRCSWDDFRKRVPCGKTRAQLLSQPHVMEEALSIYREVQARRSLEA